MHYHLELPIHPHILRKPLQVIYIKTIIKNYFVSQKVLFDGTMKGNRYISAHQKIMGSASFTHIRWLCNKHIRLDQNDRAPNTLALLQDHRIVKCTIVGEWGLFAASYLFFAVHKIIVNLLQIMIASVRKSFSVLGIQNIYNIQNIYKIYTKYI